MSVLLPASNFQPPRLHQLIISAPDMSDKSGMDKDHGSVGSAFKGCHGTSSDETIFADQITADGSVGGTAQKVGGPFDKEGAVGKQFTEGGALGGTAQSAAETAQGEKPSAFDAQGMIGKQFTSE